MVVLRRRWLIVVGLFVLFGVLAFAYCAQQTKQYTATASINFQDSNAAQQVAGIQSLSLSVPDPASNVAEVQIGPAAQDTAKALGLTISAVHSALSIAAVGTTNFVNVSATAASPRRAARIANTYSQIFVDSQTNANTAFYRQALEVVTSQLSRMSAKQRQSASGLALEARLQTLEYLAEAKDSGVTLALPAALPTSPSSPKTARDTALGAAVGFLVGVAIAFLLDALDRVIRDPKELEEIYRLPLLGEIPESSQLSRDAPPASEGSREMVLPALEPEAFQLLQAHLRYFNVDRQLKTIVVTSQAPGDGKTTVSINLAAAAARLGSRALLIESDVRRPSIGRKLGITSDPGLTEVLIGGVKIEDATRAVTLASASGSDQATPRTLDVLLAGSVVPPNPGELVESQAMKDVLAWAAEHYDFVIVDTPPVSAVSDAFPLLGQVDGAIVVGRLGKDRRDIARQTSDTLHGVNAPLLGVVANCVPKGTRSYYYGYTTG